MRERRLAWTFCTAIAALFSLWLAAVIPASAGEAPPDPGEPGDEGYYLCHATGGENWVTNSPNSSGDAEGHLGDSHQNGEDIIPPFEHEGETLSQNWDAEHYEIWANDCAEPEPTDVPGTEEPTEVPGTEEPTEEPVSTLPDTGSLPGGGSEQGVGQELVLVSAVAAALFLGAAGWMTMRSRERAS